MYINSSYENSIVNDIKITDNEETVLKKLGEGSSKFLSKDKTLVIEHDKIYMMLDIRNQKAYVYFKRDLEDINKFIEYVDKYEFMTSRQINMLLEMDGIHIESDGFEVAFEYVVHSPRKVGVQREVCRSLPRAAYLCAPVEVVQMR